MDKLLINVEIVICLNTNVGTYRFDTLRSKDLKQKIIQSLCGMLNTTDKKV